MGNNYKITKEDLKEAFSNPTRIKGMALKEGAVKAVKEKLGGEAIKLIEKESKNLGFPLELEKVKDLEWYPTGMIIEIFFILQEKFNFKEKDFAELGGISLRASIIMKLLMRYFTVPEKIAKIAASRLWRRYFDRGKVEILDFQDSKEEGHFFIKIKDFKLHPLHFFYLGHFFLGMAKMAKKFQEIRVEETKSPFKGDKYQEYLIKWRH